MQRSGGGTRCGAPGFAGDPTQDEQGLDRAGRSSDQAGVLIDCGTLDRLRSHAGRDIGQRRRGLG